MSSVRHRHRHRLAAVTGARGLSLIELMVALTIGIMLILGVVQIFSASQAAYQLSEGIARTQENSRFALDYLQRDLRMVGHLGCVNDQAHMQSSPATLSNLLATADNPALLFEQPIQGYEAVNSGVGAVIDLPATPSVAKTTYSPALPRQYLAALDNRVDGSDIVALRFLTAQGVAVSAVAGSSAAPIFSFDAKRFALLRDGVDSPGVFGVADCVSTSIFQAAAVDGDAGRITTGQAPANASATFSAIYEASQATLYRAESLVYYVGRNDSGATSLYRVRFNAEPGKTVSAIKEELVEGVRNMQIMYGQDRVTDPASSPTGYIDALRVASDVEASVSGQAAAGWRRVGSVRLGLLLASPDRATATQAAADSALNMLGVGFTVPSDGRYRATYQTTIALRNRLYGN